jgi:hypothetical protein
MYRNNRRRSAETGGSTIMVLKHKSNQQKHWSTEQGGVQPKAICLNQPDVQLVTDQIDFRPNKAWTNSVA